MPRKTLGAVSLTALAVAAAGVLVGCGDDSTATSTPTSLSASPTAAPTSSAATSTAGDSDDAEGSGQLASPGPAATAPPETPQAQPSDFPGPEATPMGEREQSLVDALADEGIEVSGNGESAVAIANYICAATQANEPEPTIVINVNAMTGVEQSITGTSMSPEQAGQIYIDVAKSSYCS
jgi:Protein of unknown function (DUF732)